MTISVWHAHTLISMVVIQYYLPSSNNHQYQLVLKRIRLQKYLMPFHNQDNNQITITSPMQSFYRTANSLIVVDSETLNLNC